ncbi:MAG TPA: DUF1800 domain-containing protein [Verrucomicrobiota bacterium]|nr:DUF1800 domain-containing protein [Verrucomicrobiota bacterium]HNT15776.1 DUF1800 domain-containing protein [Verrucomicrobiota bacterium]
MLKPLSSDRWNATTAAHLLNRAGFGGPPREIQQLVALGPERAVARLVDFEKIPDATPNPGWARPDPERRNKLQAFRRADAEQRRELQREERRQQREQMTELRHWWLGRMARGPRPFQEKMVLFWHGHFATSVDKVREPYLMWRQNELFRRLAVDHWLRLLVETGQDPAMLIWLDQARSRKQHPNENFAREVMELFTLGEGHYTEKDITEAARALTGWSYNRETQQFVDRPALHDPGVKTVLGRTGRLQGRDVLEQIVAQPQAARFITAKLWTFFAGQPPSEALLTALAASFRQHGNHFKPFLRVMLRSEEFYDPALIRTQVKSPVQWLAGTIRMLETELPPPQLSGILTRELGQDLFAPPNVKGWDGGLSWITTNTLLARYNQAALLVQGSGAARSGGRRKPRQAGRGPMPRPRPPALQIEVTRLFSEAERREPGALIAALGSRLFQTELKANQQAALREYLDSQGVLDDDDILGAIRLAMSTPEYQLT